MEISSIYLTMIAMLNIATARVLAAQTYMLYRIHYDPQFEGGYQKQIWNPVQKLWWGTFAKTINV